MEKYKISNLIIKNFKCFDEIDFNLETNSLIIFDGPNGYGKTTAFEALEILLTKTPRKLSKVRLDKRYSYKNSPIHKNEAKPIEITAVFYSNNYEPLKIKRVIPVASKSLSKKNNIGQIFSDSILYINEVKSSEDALEEVLGFVNIQNLFNVLNYVEQDENTYFLKEDPKERYKALITLLGGSEERILHDKTLEFSKKIKEKREQLDTEINQINAQNIQLLNQSNDKLEYRQLLQSTTNIVPWDSQQINNIDLDIYNSYIAEINKVENLYNHRNVLESAITLRKLTAFLNDPLFIHSLVDNFWSISNFQALEDENSKRKINQEIISEYESLIGLINDNNYSGILANKSLLELEKKDDKPPIDFIKFQTQIKSVISLRDSLSAQNLILSDLKDKRENLNKLIEEHRSLTNLDNGQCHTCGFIWGENKELNDRIAETEERIFKSYTEDNAKLEELKAELLHEFLSVIKSFAQSKIQVLNSDNAKLIETSHFNDLKGGYKRLNARFEELLSLLTSETQHSIRLLIDTRIIDDREKIITHVSELLEKSKPEIDGTINIDEISNDFSLYFSENRDQIERLNNEDFIQKRLYIQFQYYNAVNQTLQQLILRKEKLDYLYNEVNSISEKIDEKIKQYTKSIVEKISIPFYIFTGKILQNHSLGSGLLLILDINKESSQIYIRPKYRDQEVTYTLSSGQLAATVISLMLVLNKVFNNSKMGTILIDDPLQTLDEINSHSLVELLKYNFGNQQIILSTHEDRYSQFIQYKFNKFNLPNKSLRLKDLV